MLKSPVEFSVRNIMADVETDQCCGDINVAEAGDENDADEDDKSDLRPEEDLSPKHGEDETADLLIDEVEEDNDDDDIQIARSTARTRPTVVEDELDPIAIGSTKATFGPPSSNIAPTTASGAPLLPDLVWSSVFGRAHGSGGVGTGVSGGLPTGCGGVNQASTAPSGNSAASIAAAAVAAMYMDQMMMAMMAGGGGGGAGGSCGGPIPAVRQQQNSGAVLKQLVYHQQQHVLMLLRQQMVSSISAAASAAAAAANAGSNTNTATDPASKNGRLLSFYF